MSALEVFFTFFSSFFSGLWSGFKFLLNPLFIIPIGIILAVYIVKNKEYKKTSYYKITKHPFISLRFNVGNLGEYLTYKYLRSFETNGARFLFNVYIPKENGETTEIDVLMISTKGIFVFESKNYSGWIFGNEWQKKWYQTLPQGRGKSHKEEFYNPIMQNRSHISHLKAFLGEDLPMHSVIVFSERCTLKNVQVKSADINVIKRSNVLSVVENIYNRETQTLIAPDEVEKIYSKLFSLTQVDEKTKQEHIKNINSKKESLQTNIAKDNLTDSVAIAVTATGEKVSESQQQSNDDNVSISVKLCPRCGSELVLRKATKGANAGKSFYGCSAFPKCRYIENFEE